MKKPQMEIQQVSRTKTDVFDCNHERFPSGYPNNLK